MVCQDAQSETALRLATCLTLSGPSTVSGTLSEAVKMTKNWKIAVNVLLTENVTLIQTPMERKIQPSAAVPRAKVQNILVQNFVTANLISLGLYGTCRRSLGCTLRSNRRHHHCKDHLNHNCALQARKLQHTHGMCSALPQHATWRGATG